MAHETDWEGSATQLLPKVNDLALASLTIDYKARSWPKSANYLSKRIREIRLNLASLGIFVELDNRTPKTRSIRKTHCEPVTEGSDGGTPPPGNTVTEDGST